MRDLVFKNLISNDKKRRVFSSSEVVDKEGIRSVIRRHFVCMLKEIKEVNAAVKPLPYLYVLKSKNSKENREKFFCRIKGSLFAQFNGKQFLVLYMHSLKICFSSAPLKTDA